MARNRAQRRAAARSGGEVAKANRGGVTVPGNQITLVNSGYTVGTISVRASTGIVQGNGADWFGPLNPMAPTAPVEVKSRRLDFMSGYNLQQRPRPLEISFEQLRGFAEAYDLLRLVIETRKDQIARQKWSIRPRDPEAKMEKGDPLFNRAKKLEEFWLRPDKRNFWGKWLRQVMEEVLVTDALTLYRRRTRGGGLYALEQIDGSTIAVRIDDWGRTPAPPAPAYQQVLKGMPAVDYTSAELLYQPRNIRAHKIYGFSPVEQIIMTVSIGLKRQIWQLQYFTDGNIPDSLIGVPQTWTPDQIRNFQDDWDSMMEGNTGMRRRARFVPGEVAKSYVPTKDAEMFGMGEEWLARVVCFAFGVSPQPFIKQMNRATAETAAEEAMLDGLSPLMQFIKELVDTVLIEDFQETELEFAWIDDREPDPKLKTDLVTEKVKTGLLSINEGRQELGSDPYDDKAFDVPRVYTATGYVPISADDDIAEKQQRMDAFPPAPALDASGQPTAAPGGGPGAVGGRPAAGAPGAGGGASGKPPAAAAGKKPPAGGAGAAKEAADEMSSGRGGPEAEEVSAQKAAPSKALLAPSPDRRLCRRTMASMKKTMASSLAALGKSVGAQVRAALEESVGKADEPTGHGSDGAQATITDPELAAAVRKIVDGLDLDSLVSVISDVGEDLTDVAEDSAMLALAQVGVPTTKGSELVNRVSERAVAFAEERAAELVGMRKMADGTIVPNPSARWAITDATRDMLRSDITRGLADNIGTDKIVENIEKNYAFSPERAEAIGRTEVARANSYGSLDGYRTARDDAGVSVQKSWVTVGDDDVDTEICEPNEDQGPIDLDDAFTSGDDAPPGHPNCRCVLVPVVSTLEGGEADA